MTFYKFKFSLTPTLPPRFLARLMYAYVLLIHFSEPKTFFTDFEREILEREEVHRQFKDLEGRGEFEAANVYLQSQVARYKTSNPHLTVEKGERMF
jgi:hypothetical protein